MLSGTSPRNMLSLIGVLSPNRRKFQTAPFHANSQSIPAKTASRSIGDRLSRNA